MSRRREHDNSTSTTGFDVLKQRGDRADVRRRLEPLIATLAELEKAPKSLLSLAQVEIAALWKSAIGFMARRTE